MKYAFRTSVAAIGVLLAFTGCVPFNVPRTPAARGFAIDTASRLPISGARVYFRGSTESAASAGPDGFFEIPAKTERHWLPPLPFDFAAVPGIMIIEAPGYAQLVFDQKNDRWPEWSKDGKGGFLWSLKAEPNQSVQPTPGAVTPRAKESASK